MATFHYCAQSPALHEWVTGDALAFIKIALRRLDVVFITTITIQTWLNTRKPWKITHPHTHTQTYTHTHKHTHKTNAQIISHVTPLLRARRPNGTFKKTQARGSKQETEYKTANVTNSAQIWVMCINGCSGTTAEPTLITWPCKTTHTKSGNNDDKPSGKWTRSVQQEITCRRYPASLCLHDKSYPAVNILRIIELIVICSFSVWIKRRHVCATMTFRPLAE